jgi:hypothetical protein
MLGIATSEHQILQDLARILPEPGLSTFHAAARLSLHLHRIAIPRFGIRISTRLHTLQKLAGQTLTSFPIVVAVS